MSQIAMIPDGSLSDCEAGQCTWSADLPALSSDRDESVTYYITAQDNSVAGVNTVQTADATFKSALPTNTLVLEWRGLSSDSTGLNTCTFQTIMYDVTNEFEFHYDESCSADQIQGIIGHRMMQQIHTQSIIKTTLALLETHIPIKYVLPWVKMDIPMSTLT